MVDISVYCSASLIWNKFIFLIICIPVIHTCPHTHKYTERGGERERASSNNNYHFFFSYMYFWLVRSNVCLCSHEVCLATGLSMAAVFKLCRYCESELFQVSIELYTVVTPITETFKVTELLERWNSKCFSLGMLLSNQTFALLLVYYQDHTQNVFLWLTAHKEYVLLIGAKTVTLAFFYN